MQLIVVIRYFLALFPSGIQSLGQVTHVLLTRPPLAYPVHLVQVNHLASSLDLHV